MTESEVDVEAGIPYTQMSDLGVGDDPRTYGWIRPTSMVDPLILATAHLSVPVVAAIPIPHQRSSLSESFHLPEIDGDGTGGTGGAQDVTTGYLGSLGKDPDSLFNEAEAYHRSHGFVVYLMRTIRYCFASTLGIALFVFFTLVLDVGNLQRCLSEKSREACTELFVCPLENSNLDHWLAPAILGTLNTLFTLYWVLLVVRFVRRVKIIFRMKRFYEQTLQISPQMLSDGMTWSQVADRIASYHASGQIPCIKSTLILNRRRIALFMHRVDDIYSALLREINLADTSGSKDTPRSCGTCGMCNVRGAYPSFLAWIIRTVIVGSVWTTSNAAPFEYKMRKNHEFLSTPGAVSRLKQKLRFLGVVAFLLGWVIAIFYASQTFFNNVQRFANKNYDTTQYRWTGYAKAILRCRAEGRQSLSIRLREMSKCAEAAIHCYPNYLLNEVLRLINLPLGIIVGLIVLITFNDNQTLFSIVVVGNALIVYLAVLGPLTLNLREYLSSFNKNVTIDKMDDDERELLRATLVSLVHSDAHSDDSLADLSEKMSGYYRHKTVIFVKELLGILLLWKSLMFDLPAQAKQILQFLDRNVVADPYLGVVLAVSE